MPNSNYHDELRTRVAVLETKAEAHGKELQQLRDLLEKSNEAHLANYAEVKAKVETLEELVEELRMNTALTRETLKVLDSLTDQVKVMNENINAIQLDSAKQKGFIAAVFFVGSAAWGLFSAFKDQILGWLCK
jgi:chromosome segregation ATPase